MSESDVAERLSVMVRIACKYASPSTLDAARDKFNQLYDQTIDLYVGSHTPLVEWTDVLGLEIDDMKKFCAAAKLDIDWRWIEAPPDW